MARFRALLLAIGMVLLAACSGTGPADPGLGPLAGLADAVGPLPQSPHAVSDTSTIDGDDFDVPGPGVTAQAPTALLDAAGLCCSWARYVYGMAPGATLNSLQIDVQDVSTGFWIALPDYAAETWRWHGPFNDGIVLVPDAGWGDYISPTDNLYWLVVAASGHSLRVLGSSVDYEPVGETIFFVPPDGQHTAASGPASNPQLVLMPADLPSAEEGAPVIFFTADDGGSANTFIAYYDGSAWTQRLLFPLGPRVTHAAVGQLPASDLGPVMIGVMNADAGSTALYPLQADLSMGPFGDRMPPHTDPDGTLAMLAMDCIDSSNWCVAQARSSGGDAVVAAYYDDSWADPKEPYSHELPGEQVAGLDVVHGSTSHGSPVVAYSHGTVDTTDIVLLDFGITLATPEWTTQDIDYNEPLSLDLEVSPEGDLMLLMVSGRDFELVMPPPPLPPVVDITATLYYDVVLGTWLGSEWEYDPLFESTLGINILQSTADVDLGADISWAGNGAFSMSHVDGTVEVDISDGFEITGGTLTNNSEYWMKLGGGFGHTDIFTGDAGALFDWQENSAGGFSCAYIKAESVEIEDLLGGSLETAGDVIYWSPDG